MRHSNNYIALSLLAAAFAGCSSTDTGSTSTSSSGGQDPLTGPLAVYQSKLSALTGTKVFDSAHQKLTIGMLAADTLLVLSKSSVDSSILVNGVAVTDATVTPNVTALATNVKSIAVTETGNTVGVTALIDIRNGTFATKSGSTGGITIDLGTDSTNELAILGSTGGDNLGCAHDAAAGDQIGLKSATGADVTLGHAVSKVTMDLNDGNDTFDQGACTTAFTVFGGAGNDKITAGSVGTTKDTYSGGAGTDTLSYANRTVAIEINATAGTVDTSWTAHTAGISTELDAITDDFEVLTGGSGADKIYSGVTLTTGYTLDGGPGDDTFYTTKTFPATIKGGTGTDTVSYLGRGGAVTATMGDGKANDGETGDADNIGNDVENYVASTHGDTVTGNSLNNVFSSNQGNDTFNGGTGDDTFLAIQGSGTHGEDGDDVFSGGAGTDTVDYKARTGGSICLYMDGTTKSGYCALSTTVWAVTTAPASGDSDTIGSDVENATGTSSADFITGNDVANVLLGYGGGDWIKGKLGDDQIDLDNAAGVCPKATAEGDTSQVDCGSDSLDIVTCKGVVPGTKMFDATTFWTAAGSKCWKVQK